MSPGITNRRRVGRGLVVWIAGLAIGSVAQMQQGPSTLRPVVTVGSTTYQVLAADFHVHSFPGDGALLPWDVAREAHRRGLDAIALTNHNHMLEWDLVTAARPLMPKDMIVLAGEEVTSPGFHLAAVGIRGPVRWSRSAADVIDAVHAAGGVAIAAHPGHPSSQAYDEAALRALDGVEAAHPLKETDEQRRRAVEAFYARVLAANPSIAAIGSSDFHQNAPIGSSRTFVFATERTEAGILDALRAGRSAGCDLRGDTTGAEPWARLSTPSCKAAAGLISRSPSRSGGVLNAFAVGCALVGLAAAISSSRDES
ncbi:MAG: CehA/McbA family metallohydrolase [Acidobacteriota bacterium]